VSTVSRVQTVFDLRSGGRNGQVSGRVERRGGHCVKAGHGGFRDNDAELGDAGRAGGPVERDPQVAAIAEVVDVDHIGERCGRQPTSSGPFESLLHVAAVRARGIRNRFRTVGRVSCLRGGPGCRRLRTTVFQ
jgi:hypothetical protein